MNYSIKHVIVGTSLKPKVMTLLIHQNHVKMSTVTVLYLAIRDFHVFITIVVEFNLKSINWV